MLSDSSEPQSGTWCSLGALVRRLGVDLVWINTTCLESTLTMLKHKLETGIEVVRDYDRSLPRLPAYAGELNQVWTT
jgi:nitrogen-specific signal transduction histidine kinase